MLKWPNDLWLVDAPPLPGRGRKLGGILIETVTVGQRRMCVVGVGLNVLPQAVPELPQGYACLQEILPDISAPAALARVAEPLVRALLQFQAQGFAPLAAGLRARVTCCTASRSAPRWRRCRPVWPKVSTPAAPCGCAAVTCTASSAVKSACAWMARAAAPPDAAHRRLAAGAGQPGVFCLGPGLVAARLSRRRATANVNRSA